MIIKQMLERYELKSIEDKKNAIKEIMQEITLASLSKTSFFKNAAFYGGTALRIFYGLDRFSEDLDFTLITEDDNIDLNNYLLDLSNSIESLGLNFEITEKKKITDSQIKSAFLKGNTREQFLIFYPTSNDDRLIPSNEKIQIKFEIDINPPMYANTELKYRLLPFPYEVRVYDKPSLFAGKIHAVIARSWQNRIKGRDLYDYIFYLTSNTPVNLKHLEARLKQTNTIDYDVTLTKELLLEMLNKRFDSIDYQKAKADVIPFIKDISVLNIWSNHFFKDISSNIKTI
ncbi:MAG: nucleotidyl transferase AbiEii/AbiGii toxin family protein [Acholeplasma sp.]|nr:nucleotidyl transferase AbiEii/AbiGii toxin family protein [Acholeplasma sp.]